MLHLIIALLDLAEVLGVVGIVLGLYGLVLVAHRLSDEVPAGTRTTVEISDAE